MCNGRLSGLRLAQTLVAKPAVGLAHAYVAMQQLKALVRTSIMPDRGQGQEALDAVQAAL